MRIAYVHGYDGVTGPLLVAAAWAVGGLLVTMATVTLVARRRRPVATA